MSKPVQRPKKEVIKKAATPKKKAATAKAGRAESQASTAEPSVNRDKQVQFYERAMELFHAGDFATAKDAFEAAIAGPSREMAHSARVYQRVCERRLGVGEVKLPTPEDHYNYAITLINRRQLDSAFQHLEEALETKPNADHIHYALALTYGLQGKFERAATHLVRAIEIEPKNRNIARNDIDFESFSGAPPIRAVLYPERKSPE